ncbi:MAG: dienelactone hydrolase family protein [Pseudomonadota bacterium]
MGANTTYAPFTDRFTFEAFDMRHEVFRAGAGPAVLVMHELPGMVPEFWRFAHWLVEQGFTVWAPDLYSAPGRPSKALGPARGLWRACISREIHLFATNASSPVTIWLRALTREMYEKVGGAGVGVIGMCMTGNFALSLVVDVAVRATVASQPALPLALTARGKSALHMSEMEKDALSVRTDVPVMALRFQGDPSCTRHRFDAIETLVGEERFRPIVLPDTAQNPKGNPFPHAVLTKDLIDAEGEPTKQAAEAVFTFLKENLQPAKNSVE